MTVAAPAHAQAELVPLASLRPADWNPRTISTERFKNLCRSIERDPDFLWLRPVLATRDGTIYGGNMRYRAVEHLGWREVPAVVDDVAEHIARERMVRDNSQWGEWHDQELAEIIATLEAQQVDVSTLGLGKDEVERLLALVGLTHSGGNDADFDPTPPAVAETQPGDVLVLGPHVLVCGSSGDEGTWRRLFDHIEGDAADCMWTDPPYGVDLQIRSTKHRMDKDKGRRTNGEDAFEGDKPEDLQPLLASAFPLIDRHLKAGAPIYIAGPSGPMERVFLEEIIGAGWRLASPGLVWVKDSFVPGRSDYHPQHEMIFYAWKPGAGHVWIGAPDQASVFELAPDPSKMKVPELVRLVRDLQNRLGTSVVRVPKTRHNDLHPTMKPPALVMHMLANSTRRGDLVLDPFAGSGSTMVAAQRLGRRTAMIELEPRFCDVIARRWLELEPGHEMRRIR